MKHNEQRRQRLQYILDGHNGGRTFADIGRELGRSGGRIAQLYHQAERVIEGKYNDEWYEWELRREKEHPELFNSASLEIRVINALLNSQIRPLTAKHLATLTLETLEVIPNIGKMAIAQIAAFCREHNIDNLRFEDRQNAKRINFFTTG